MHWFKHLKYAIVFLFLVCYCDVEAQLILMRHGQAEHNVQDIYNADASHPNYKPSHLTQEGQQQALQTAQDLMRKGFNPTNIQIVYVSPLSRTQETAQILVKAGLISQDAIVVDARLTEVQVGDLEGKPIIRPWTSAEAAKYQTESDEHINSRLRAFYQDLLSSCEHGTVLVITHGIPAQRLMEIIGVAGEKKLNPGMAHVLSCEARTL